MNTENATGKGLSLDGDKTVQHLLQGLLVVSAKADSNSKEIELAVNDIISEVRRLREKLVDATKIGSQATSLYVSKNQQGKELLTFSLWNKSLEELADVIAGFDCLLYLENDKSRMQDSADG